MNLLGGDHAGAAREAASAAQGLTADGAELLAATAVMVRARASVKGDRGLAVDLFRQAADAYDRCGAIWRRDRSLTELRRLGAAGRRAAGEVRGPTSLTAREREVAGLAAAGYTAREIGERLFIGTRTVETHLGSVYGKLGIRSKRELVRRREELNA